MLDIIKNATNSWISKILLTIFILCFILLWGIPQFYVRNERDLLTSGQSTITVDRYRLALFNHSFHLALSSRLGRMFTSDEIQKYGIPIFVFNQLQQDVLLDEQARKMKINLSKDTVARAIGSDNIFQNNGTFDRDLFLNYLQKLQINENHLLDYYKKSLIRNQLISAALSGMKVPDFFYKAFAIYQEEKRVADYLVIDLEKEKTTNPDRATLQKWFSEHKDEFRTPEYRTVSLLSLTLTELTKPENISKDEVKAYYTENISRFMVPEKRTIEKLQFSTRESADQARKKIRDGLSFDDLVRAEKKTLQNITEGPLAEDELPRHLASKIFALKQGTVSAVINDLQGPIIVRVTHITPAQSIAFENVEKDIRQTLAKNYAVAEMRNHYTEIENSRLEGTSLQNIANQYKLPLRTITIDKTGTTLEGITLTDLPQKDVLLASIYQSDKGAELDPLSLQGEGYLWYEVNAIIPARDRTLNEVEKDALFQWKSQEVQRLLDEKAQNILTQLTEGKTLDLLSKELGITKQTTPVLRRRDTLKVFGLDGVRSLFLNPKGYCGTLKGAVATNRIVYKITESIIPEDTSAYTLPSDIRDTMDRAIGEDLSLGMLQIANKEHPIEINESNYNRIFRTLQ